MTLKVISQGHSPFAGLFKCNPSNICAVFYQISTDNTLAWSLSASWASSLHEWSCSIIGEGLLWRCSSTNSSVFRQWNEVEKFSSLSSSVQTKTSPQPVGTAPTDDQTACTHHARRRSSSSGHPRASVTSLLYADGHVAHDAPRALYRSRATVSLLSTPDRGSWAGAGTSRRWPCSTRVTTISGFLSSSVKLHGRRTISGKLLAFGFVGTMRLLSNYFDLLLIKRLWKSMNC